ncbi:GDP-mannose 4,6-dehydratase, partial [Providencia stuartii]
MKYLITGCAGFIGFHLSKYLLNHCHKVVGIDNINNYYDIDLKNNRLSILNESSNFSFLKADITDKQRIVELFKNEKFDKVIHLA